MLLCDFDTTAAPDGFRQVCRVCGNPEATPTAKYYRHCQGNPPPGLGDLIANGFERLGIRKERFSAWIGAECGCAERQEKLNLAGRYLKMRAAKMGITLPF
jgi:hypothetical protein